MLKYEIVNQSWIKGRVLLVKEPDWNSEFLNIFRNEGCQHLRLSYSMGWRQTELDFLDEFSEEELLGLDVVTMKTKDLSMIQKFRKLRNLCISIPCNKAPDMSNFPDLEVLMFDHRNSLLPSYKATNPWALNVGKYPFEDLKAIESFKKLRYLQIHGGNLTRLDGLENFPELAHISLYGLRKLESIDLIEKLPHINAIEVERCKNVESVRKVRYHKMSYI